MEYGSSLGSWDASSMGLAAPSCPDYQYRGGFEHTCEKEM
jgi:hypothetical protein